MNISIGQLIDRSWSEYRSEFFFYLKVALWFLVPAAVYSIGVLMAPASTNAALVELRGLTSIERVGLFIEYRVTGIVLLLTMAFVGNLTLKHLQLKEQGQSNKAALQEAMVPRLFPLAGHVILKYLVLSLPTLLVLPGFLMAFFAAKYGLGILGLVSVLVLILGAIAGILVTLFIWLRLFLSYPIFTIEELGIWKSIKASYQRTKGQFWPLALRLVVTKGVYLAALILISLGLLILATVFFIIVPFTSEVILVKTSLIVENLISVAPVALIVPLWYIVDFELYKELKRLG